MKKYLFSLLFALSSPFLCVAQNAPVRPDIEELFKVMRVEQSMQTAMEQVKKMVPQLTTNISRRQSNLPSEAEVKSAVLQAKIIALVEEEMNWPKIKSEVSQIYAEILTPEETKGIIDFFKSPSGQTFLNKQPLIMEKTVAMNQKLMMNLIPKMQALIQAETGAESKNGAPSIPGFKPVK